MFGTRLTELRKQKKLTQTDVANALGVARTT
ncbi:helix-turn-helix domain-containing protein, partial [Enterococcus faecalis]